MKEYELKKIISDTIINNLDPDSFSRTVHNSAVDLIGVFNDFANQDKLIEKINELEENKPLYKDSGLWQIRSDDMEDVLFQQGCNESFQEFIKRVHKATAYRI